MNLDLVDILGILLVLIASVVGLTDGLFHGLKKGRDWYKNRRKK